MEDRPNALVVPSAAIQSGLQGLVCLGHRVTTPREQRLHKMQQVKVALAEGQVTILDSGLARGPEIVVVDGADRLRPDSG